jgi:hypothetical protein
MVLHAAAHTAVHAIKAVGFESNTILLVPLPLLVSYWYHIYTLTGYAGLVIWLR